MNKEIVSIICIILIILCVFSMIRNVIIGCKYRRLLLAINNYRMWCAKINITPKVNYSDLKEYYTIFFNIFNWKYTDIISKNQYEIVKPFFE